MRSTCGAGTHRLTVNFALILYLTDFVESTLVGEIAKISQKRGGGKMGAASVYHARINTRGCTAGLYHPFIVTAREPHQAASTRKPPKGQSPSWATNQHSGALKNMVVFFPGRPVAAVQDAPNGSIT